MLSLTMFLLLISMAFLSLTNAHPVHDNKLDDDSAPIPNHDQLVMVHAVSLLT